MSADEIRLPSPAAVADLAGRELCELDRLARLDKIVADLTSEAQAYVGDLYRLRRETIRSVVDDERAQGSRRSRVEAVAARLGISVTQVYQAIRVSRPRV